MGMLNRFGRKNKKSEHYQRNYAEVEIQGDGINIGGSSSGLVQGKKEEKEQYYRNVKSKITEQDKHGIKLILASSRTIYEVFSKMEDERIPLDYLVAMELAEEIDIESYQNVKAKGLDTGATMTYEDVEEVDETLRMQIKSQSKDVPEIKDGLTDEELGLIESDKYVDEYQQVVSELEKEDVSVEKEPQQKQETQEVEREDISNELENNESDNTEEEKEEPKLSELKNLAEKLREKGKKDERRETQQQEEEERERRKNIRGVYVIGKEMLLPVVEGYSIRIVKGMKDVLEYTSSKRSMLVITQDIPKEMQGELMEWLRGISNGSSKYRITTLKGSAVGHGLIEDTIELTKESLDAYYIRYPDEEYEGVDVEGFLDISSFIE